MMDKKLVFLFDVDNTLLDNDRVTADLKRQLETDVGHERQERYWIISVHSSAIELSIRAIHACSPFRIFCCITRLPIDYFLIRSTRSITSGNSERP